MKYIFLIFTLCVGCNSPHQDIALHEVRSFDLSPIQAHPLPFEIQINSIPHPFNVNGNIPYCIWINGERLTLNRIQAETLVNSLNLRFTQLKNTAEIHNGAGWIRPLNLNTD